MKIFILLTSFFLAFFTASAQDVLTRRNGEELQVKVTEVTPTEVKYKLFDNPEGPVYTLPKSQVFSVQYQKGQKEVFPEQAPAAAGENMYLKGKSDALTSYRNYNGAGTGTLVTSMVSPVLGLIPAIACSATPPKEENLGYTHADFLRNSEYRAGYTQQAKKIKSRKVWKNWSIGLGANLLVFLVIHAGQ